MNIHVFTSMAVVGCAVFLIQYFSDELDVGQRIYAYVMIVPLVFLQVYVPFYIPPTGEIVYAFAWERIEYPDRQMQKMITPQLVKKVEAELKKPPAIGVDPDWVRNSVMNRAYPSRRRSILNTGLFLLLSGAGWWIIPPWINRRIYDRSADD